MESTAYFHRIFGIVPWNPLNFHGINGKNLWLFMNFHNFLLLVYLPSIAMETLKTPSEYSVDFNRGFQGFSMANLEMGIEPKTENCFSPISFDWIFRRITKVQNFHIYFYFKVAMVTKMGDKIGLKQRNCHFGLNSRLLEIKFLRIRYQLS